MQEMNEKLAFSQRVKQTLSNYDWAKISPTWLAREFNLRYNGKSISVQAVNNWLMGIAIPTQDKLQILAAWLNVSIQWLRFGEQSSIPQPTISPTSSFTQTLSYRFARLSPQQQLLVSELVDALLINSSSTHLNNG